jgi:regulator of sirC expression with transglutaminase-like and TPR domain
MGGTSHQRFLQLASRPDPEINLTEGALLIAQSVRPQLNIEKYVELLDDWAEQLKPRLEHAFAPEHWVAQLNQFLFKELGFSGNLKNYYDPENSFLDTVLDRRVGIPITLALVYAELARRVNFQVVGVGMPGHFLLQPADRQVSFYIDCFYGGQILRQEDCARRLDEIYSGSLKFEPGLLSRVSRKQWLARLLLNLKRIFLQTEEFERALSMVDKLLCLLPEASTEYRDRGILYFRLGNLQSAIIDLQKYLLYEPQAPDAAQIRQMVLGLQARLRKQLPKGGPEGWLPPPEGE